MRARNRAILVQVEQRRWTRAARHTIAEYGSVGGRATGSIWQCLALVFSALQRPQSENTPRVPSPAPTIKGGLLLDPKQCEMAFLR